VLIYFIHRETSEAVEGTGRVYRKNSYRNPGFGKVALYTQQTYVGVELGLGVGLGL